MALNLQKTNLILPSTICPTDIHTPLHIAGAQLAPRQVDAGPEDYR